ncbi:MFS transporter, partial [Actinomyces sp.]|uniref:MFS transporter n=1 Tax=Actinomyces sp. TaxID=29317 RepID=UPI0037C16971
MTSPTPDPEDARPVPPGDAGTGVPWSRQEVSLLISSVALITLSAFEALATTTIMPAVVHDLGAESWFSVASGAALAAQLLATVLAGALSDSRGARPVLLGGMGLFVLGLVMCALAPHVAVFVAGRVVQGIGGGMVIVPLYVLVGSVATERHRASFFAAFSLAWVLPSLVGPAIAGLVTSQWGWRPVFGVVPALALLAGVPLLAQMRRMDLPTGGADVDLPHLARLALGAGAGV